MGTESKAAELDVGSVIDGRYELVSELGKGAFGVVYKARQLATEQQVAVKVINLDVPGGPTIENRLARFKREMLLCGRLYHPNIVRLIDHGLVSASLAYAVFAFIPGKNLREVLSEEGALGARETHHLMLQVLDALACAHAQGIVHRDLKPSNIMVSLTGARRNALVLDFGLGAVAESDGGDRITGTNELLGTPSYSAPEQLRGVQAMPQSDLFSWGLVFIECLTGRKVVAGETLLSVIGQQMGLEPVPMPQELEAHPLSALLRRALEKDMHAREKSASALLHALADCGLEGLVVPSEAPEAPGTARVAPDDATLTLLRTKPAPNVTPFPRSTALCVILQVSSDVADPAELDPLLHSALHQCEEVVGRFGGSLAAVMGNQALFQFGAPAASPDNASRAALAALALREAAPRWSLPSAHRVELQIGIESGPMPHAKVDRSLAGEPGGFAGLTSWSVMCLAAAAPLGSVVVGPAARRSLSERFQLRETTPLSLKGFCGTLEAALLLDDGTVEARAV